MVNEALLSSTPAISEADAADQIQPIDRVVAATYLSCPKEMEPKIVCKSAKGIKKSEK